MNSCPFYGASLVFLSAVGEIHVRDMEPSPHLITQRGNRCALITSAHSPCAREMCGTCVMGRGCAREAAKKWPGLPRIIGARIKESGNDVFLWTEYLSGKEPTVVNQLLIFPVKHKWMEPADPNLISMSAASLAVFAAQRPSTIFLLPRPGCGNGQLDWKDVKPLLEFLPDNVLVITNEEQADG